jgi:hypothetical protein
MDIAIVTTTDTWITHVSNHEFAGCESGAAARSVRDRIKAEEPIEVHADVSDRRELSRRGQMAVFNPGHVVAVMERWTDRHR